MTWAPNRGTGRAAGPRFGEVFLMALTLDIGRLDHLRFILLLPLIVHIFLTLGWSHAAFNPGYSRRGYSYNR